MNDIETKKFVLLLFLIIIVNIYFVSRIPNIHEGLGTNIITPAMKAGIKLIPNKTIKDFLKKETKNTTDETMINDLGFAGFKLILGIAILPIVALFFTKVALFSAGTTILSGVQMAILFMFTEIEM